MVGHLTLDQQIGVRIPAPQLSSPRKTARYALYYFSKRPYSCAKIQPWYPHTQISIPPYTLVLH